MCMCGDPECGSCGPAQGLRPAGPALPAVPAGTAGRGLREGCAGVIVGTLLPDDLMIRDADHLARVTGIEAEYRHRVVDGLFGGQLGGVVLRALHGGVYLDLFWFADGYAAGGAELRFPFSLGDLRRAVQDITAEASASEEAL